MRLLTPEFSLLSFQGLLLLVAGLWLWALVDVLRNDFKGRNEKLIWVLTVIFVPLFGSILYLFIGRKHKINYN